MGHIEVVHKKVRYPCNLCGKKFTTKGFLKIHIASVHENVTHECNQCGKHFTIKGNLAKHIQSVHQYNCNHCEKQFTANGDLKIHTESVHEKVEFPCDLCEFKASRKSILQYHFRKEHLFNN